MENLIRDTGLGHHIRLISRGRLLLYPDEIDASVHQQCFKEDSDAEAVVGGEMDRLIVTWYGTADPEV